MALFWHPSFPVEKIAHSSTSSSQVSPWKCFFSRLLLQMFKYQLTCQLFGQMQRNVEYKFIHWPPFLHGWFLQLSLDSSAWTRLSLAKAVINLFWTSIKRSTFDDRVLSKIFKQCVRTFIWVYSLIPLFQRFYSIPYRCHLRDELTYLGIYRGYIVRDVMSACFVQNAHNIHIVNIQSSRSF